MEGFPRDGEAECASAGSDPGSAVPIERQGNFIHRLLMKCDVIMCILTVFVYC